ncbi:MAG: hypothetical protein ACI9EW_003641 [Cellvibrionaceae bacterium]
MVSLSFLLSISACQLVSLSAFQLFAMMKILRLLESAEMLKESEANVLKR